VRICAGGAGQPASLLRLEVQIGEMFGSDRNRPKDYRRAVVIDAGPKNTTNEDTLQSERRSALKKTLTEPTLLEMSGFSPDRNVRFHDFLQG
jgi:hypothetical protein